MPPLVFKALGRDNVLVNPFRVHKTQVVDYTSGSGNIDEFNVVTAIDFLDPNAFSSASAVLNADGTYPGPLFKSIEHIFYTSGALSGSADFAAAGNGFRNFPLSGSAYVLNIPQPLFGEGIRPGSFTLTQAGTTSASMVDDGQGRLVVCGSTQHVVGNIFYNLGVAVVNRISQSLGSELIYESGMHFGSGSTLRATFDATQTIYEHQIVATLEPYEFQASINPSIVGSSITGSVSIRDAMLSGTLSPYVTTIGLYNDQQELVAIAKLPNPIKRLTKTPQSFVIRFDV